ncbi:MAG: hypothetical protein IE931_08555 [Sphingobacteriales bacterium]|nr:hypothetical protein [Sphingobacteriales bacterium]
MKKVTIFLLLISFTFTLKAQNRIKRDAILKAKYLQQYGVDDSSRALIKYYVDAHSEYQKSNTNLAIASPVMLGGAALMFKNHNKSTLNQIVFWYLATSGIIYTAGFIVSKIKASKFNEQHLKIALEKYQHHQFDFSPLFSKKENFRKYLENEQ